MINDLRETLEVHRYQAQLLLEKEMYHTAKNEIDRCILLSRRIVNELAQES